MKEIVVGVDGSKQSYEALREATRLARLEGTKLRAVTAWHVPGLVYGGMGGFPLGDVRTAFEEDAHKILADALDEAMGGRNGVPVERVVHEGRAAAVLLDAANDADLLVVGCRGLGGFAGLLLGSVSQECVHHARCPVLVVHEHTDNEHEAS